MNLLLQRLQYITGRYPERIAVPDDNRQPDEEASRI